ncbi:hypothetical protein [Ruegeria sp. TM1040]|uniref:hypothetical protein n=2 Tax=Rhodobacterales TaxID=204455 RepID=UPI0000462C35|nr:hypothetical protein [Ruegeria sp. TM1040]
MLNTRGRSVNGHYDPVINIEADWRLGTGWRARPKEKNNHKETNEQMQQTSYHVELSP